MTDQDLDLLLDRWDVPEASPTMRSTLRAAIPRRPRRKLFGVVPLRWALAAGVVSWQPVISSGSGQFERGVYYRSSMRVAPPLAIWKWFQLGTCGGGRSENILYNHSTQTYVGYEMEIMPLGNGQYLMSLKPLTKTLSQLTPFAVGNYRAVPPPTVAGIPRCSRGRSLRRRLDRRSREGRTGVQPDRAFRGSVYGGLEGGTFTRARAVRRHDVGTQRPQALPERRADCRGAPCGEGQLGLVLLAGSWPLFDVPHKQRQPQLHRSRRSAWNTIEFQAGSESFRLTGVQPVNGGGDRAVYMYHQQSFHLNPDHPLSKRPLFGTAGLPVLLK